MVNINNLSIGIDIGGSGIKGAPVSMKTGEFKAERLRIPTPENAAPEDIAQIVRTIVENFDLPAEVPVGVDFPAPIVNGSVPVIANLSQEWVGVNVEQIFTKALGRPVTVLNDADAAGYAEVYFGAAKGHKGTILTLTLGTGIGSALVRNGMLIPNTEFGHIVFKGLPEDRMSAEKWAAASIRDKESLDFPEWAERLQPVFTTLELLLAPDMFIVGGGVSKHHKKFLPLIETRAPIVPAKLRNQAGIVGAALMAHQCANKKKA